jgi:hypothetical protein
VAVVAWIKLLFLVNLVEDPAVTKELRLCLLPATEKRINGDLL